MSRPLTVLRPEPGNARTAAAIEATGSTAIRLPLFAVGPVPWTPPPLDGIDALLVTSANTFRQGGERLTGLASLPVHAVGEATAVAARRAGFDVATVGSADAATLVATIPPGIRLLHLGGRERLSIAGVASVAVYAAEVLPVDPATIDRLAGSVALLHSARAAHRLAALVAADTRATMRLAALSPAIAAAAGGGWQRVAAVAKPDDSALIMVAVQLAD
ncbi:uroporphyrinogen-III synthase [Sphingomonas sp. 1P08PE]|uniref:uroporphyrinogen-III synthase n=1 Tax=Sphingomonas sp. 1P08PE TaxID=554122 RepID=UPI0039A25E35